MNGEWKNVVGKEPTIRQKRRGYEATWEISVDGDSRELAVLSVIHWGKSDMYGVLEYAYTASLGVETETDRGNGMIMRRFSIGDGSFRVETVRDVPRYSAKGARSVLDAAIIKVRELATA